MRERRAPKPGETFALSLPLADPLNSNKVVYACTFIRIDRSSCVSSSDSRMDSILSSISEIQSSKYSSNSEFLRPFLDITLTSPFAPGFSLSLSVTTTAPFVRACKKSGVGHQLRCSVNFGALRDKTRFGGIVKNTNTDASTPADYFKRIHPSEKPKSFRSRKLTLATAQKSTTDRRKLQPKLSLFLMVTSRNDYRLVS